MFICLCKCKIVLHVSAAYLQRFSHGEENQGETRVAKKENGH